MIKRHPIRIVTTSILCLMLISACIGKTSLDDNDVKWKISLGPSDGTDIREPIAIDGNMVYAISMEAFPIEQNRDEEHYLQAFDTETGQLLWKFKIPGYIDSAPVIDNSVIYLGTDAWLRGHIIAVNAQDGQRIWTYDIPGHYQIAPPVVMDEMVFVSTWQDGSPGDGYIYAIRGNSGRSLVWKKQVIGTISGPPAVEGDTVYFTSNDTIFAVDSETGEERWKLRMWGFMLGPPMVVNGMVYVGSEDNFHVLDGLTGKEQKRFPVEYGYPQLPVILGNTIYVFQITGDPRIQILSYIYQIDTETLTQKNRSEIEGRINTPPIIDGNIMYLTVSDGFLMALDMTTRDEIWRYTTDDIISTPPVMANDLLYIGDWGGYLYAIHTQ